MTTAARPLFVADWREVLFMHLALDPRPLQPHVPFTLDVFSGRAYVSLVAFTQTNFRPQGSRRRGLAARFTGLIADHAFLNLRTYVRCAGQPGICFLAEWIPSRLDAFLGPRVYGLPYRLGKLACRNERDRLGGVVEAAGATLRYFASVDSVPRCCAAGSLDEFLLECYTAFTCHGRTRRRFEIQHAPWQFAPAVVQLPQRDLLDEFTWLVDAAPAGGHYSPGAIDVRISPPRRLT